MSLDIHVFKLTPFPEDYKPYAKDTNLIFNISKEDAELLNSIVPGTCVKDDFKYYDIIKYCHENELDYSGFYCERDEEGNVILLSIKHYTDNGWEIHTDSVDNFETIPYDGTYVLNIKEFNNMFSGGSYSFISREDHPEKTYYTRKNIDEFLKHIPKQDHKEWNIADDEVIYLEY